jgi:hypothetical protein
MDQEVGWSQNGGKEEKREEKRGKEGVLMIVSAVRFGLNDVENVFILNTTCQKVMASQHLQHGVREEA